MGHCEVNRLRSGGFIQLCLFVPTDSFPGKGGGGRALNSISFCFTPEQRAAVCFYISCLLVSICMSFALNAVGPAQSVCVIFHFPLLITGRAVDLVPLVHVREQMCWLRGAYWGTAAQAIVCRGLSVIRLIAR